jgi:hypothetical protein
MYPPGVLAREGQAGWYYSDVSLPRQPVRRDLRRRPPRTGPATRAFPVGEVEVEDLLVEA